MSRVSAVVFDLDDTLMPEEAAIDAAFHATCHVAFPPSSKTAGTLTARVRTRAREAWRSSPAARHCWSVGISSSEGLWGAFATSGAHAAFFEGWLPTYRVNAWAFGLRDVGADDGDLAARLSDIFAQEVRARLSPYVGAVEAVRAVRMDYAVGLLTNGDSGVQREKIAKAGLKDEFDAVLVSGDIAVGKPDAAPFRRVLDILGVRAAQAVMVGNSLTSDVLGSHRVGMRAVWVTDGQSTPRAARPDATVSTLGELADALRELGGRR